MNDTSSVNSSSISLPCNQVPCTKECSPPQEAPSLSLLLSKLAFEWPGLRIGMELSMLIVLHGILLQFALVAGLLTPSNQWIPLGLWFFFCFFALCFDQFVLCKPVFIFRRAYHLALSGGWDEALTLLNSIAPETKSLIHCPASMFHLRKAEILTEAGMFRSAERELQLAELSGMNPDQLSVLKSRMLKMEGSDGLSKAQEELKTAATRSGETAMLCLEEGLLLLEARKDLWAAKRILKRASEMPEELHISGERTSLLARAACAATRLLTGEAEEGLQELSSAIQRLMPLAGSVDTLRPLLAFLLLERSHYLATHKEPEAALQDLRVGLTLCSYPSILKKANQIQEELSWRHGIAPEPAL